MTKFVNSLKAALLKKQAAQHPDAKASEDNTNVDRRPPAITAKKVIKKHTGRGR